jgi:hypothetical protein
VCRYTILEAAHSPQRQDPDITQSFEGWGGSTANGFPVRSPNRTSRRWNRWSRESASDRLHPVLDELGLGPRGMRGAAREALLDKRSGELATIIEASAAAAIPPANRAARSSPRRSTTTIRNPRAGCDGTIVSVMRENTSALRRRGNCVVSLTAGSVPGGIRRTGFWKSAGHPARQHELVGRETAGGPPMIGSLDTRPLSVSLSCGTSAHRARLAAPGTRT